MNGVRPPCLTPRFSAAALLRGYSLEVLTWRASIAQTCGDMLPAGSEVYVGFPTFRNA